MKLVCADINLWRATISCQHSSLSFSRALVAMAPTEQDILSRPHYGRIKTAKRALASLTPSLVYDLPPQVLETLTLRTDADNESQTLNSQDLGASHPHNATTTESSTENLVGAQACSLCGLAFSSVQEQRSHIKSDLHHYNLKQKSRGQAAATENEFEKLIGDLDESLSGSDSDDSEDDEEGRTENTLTTLLKRQARLADNKGLQEREGEGTELSSTRRRGGTPPLVWFSSTVLPEKTYFGLYRAIFTGEELRQSDLVSVVRKKQLEQIKMPRPNKDGSLPEVAYKGPHIFLCMIGGGHFAAMVVSLAPRPTKGTTMNREATVLAHKTFHRYTTRRKQGGSQSSNDNAKGAAHSAGAGIRRYNEQALIVDVRALLEDWKGLLDTSELLFIRATGATNRRTLFGPYDGQVLRHNDTRIRGFPFSTRRATQNELMRSFIELTRLKVREIVPEEAPSRAQTATPTKTASPKPAKIKLSEEEETALLHTSQLQAFIRRSKLPALLSYLKSSELSPDFEFVPPDQNHHAPRILHLAAAQNSSTLVQGILGKAGADPTAQNRQGKTPFELAGDRATRDAFRVARAELGESRWDWDAARVPAALSREDFDRRVQREKEESERNEAERKRAEEERLKAEGPKVVESKRSKGSAMATGLAKTPQEKREDEARGLTPELKTKLDRERRARAAEERMRRLQGGG